MSDPVLSLSGIRRTYATGEGELEVLKSSLLHAAGLLERPTEGTITVGGRECSRLNDRERTRIRLGSIGFVYQFHHLLAEFSALDNVALPQMMAGVPRAAARDRAAALLGELGLAERVHHQPGQLSGGEQQRVAVARALANQPRIVLADEPTGNLDPANSSAVFQSLHDLARATGVALVIATHNMELAGFMDRVFALRDGHLTQQPAG